MVLGCPPRNEVPVVISDVLYVGADQVPAITEYGDPYLQKWLRHEL